MVAPNAHTAMKVRACIASKMIGKLIRLAAMALVALVAMTLLALHGRMTKQSAAL
jgi:hypothetical protein